MSIFGSIVSRIFHHGGDTTTTADAGPAGSSTVDAVPSPAGGSSPSATAASGGSAGASPAPTPAAASAPAPGGGSLETRPAAGTGGAVDVAAVLESLAAKNPERLDWRHSIVDMLKLLGLDSSLALRKELAKELNYSGDTGDSAAMNVWLHGQVMKKLAENGGKVPADLRA